MQGHHEIIPFVKEICTDTLDNDTDGKSDCQDSDCDVECEVHVKSIRSPPFGTDTVNVSGTHTKATGIADRHPQRSSGDRRHHR